MHKLFVSACALLPSFLTVSVFIVIMSTELFCETYVAGGATVTPKLSVYSNILPLCPRGAWGGTLAKALDV